MELLQKQQLFAQLFSGLIFFANSKGYQITLDEGYRPPEVAALYAQQGRGIKNSLHTLRLAEDINLFKGSNLLSSFSDYEVLGLYWESLSKGYPEVETCWGGRFTGSTAKDLRHFSISHNGIK